MKMIGRKILAMVIAMTMVLSAMVIMNEVTNIHIGFVGEPASAWITPGIHSREGSGSLNIGSNVLNTSTGSLYYMSSIREIEANGNLNWNTSRTYHLYYPIYTGQYGGDSYVLTWAKYEGYGSGAYAPEIISSATGTLSDDNFGEGANEKDVQLNPSAIGAGTSGFAGRAGRMQRPDFFSQYKWYIIGLVAVIVLFAVYRSYKKKKLRNPKFSLRNLFKRKK